MTRREEIERLESMLPELTTAEHQELDQLKGEELRALWAVKDEYKDLLGELPGSFYTPELDAYETPPECVGCSFYRDGCAPGDEDCAGNDSDEQEQGGDDE
jgi:hypothetical protein